MIGIEVGGSDSSSSSKFERTGSSEKHGQFDLPLQLSNLIDRNAETLSLTYGDPHNKLLTSLLSRDPDYLPDAEPVRKLLERNYLEAPWLDSVRRITMVDPFSSDYERSTEQAYLDRVKRTLANIDSQMVRGGTEHTALMKGQAIADAAAQRSEHLAKQRAIDTEAALRGAAILAELEKSFGGNVLDAYKTLMTARGQNIESLLRAGEQRTQRGAAHTAALLGAARGRGNFKEKIMDDVRGWGQQESSSFAWSTGFDLCCWAFVSIIEEDSLPFYVNMGRSEFRSGPRRIGYKLMSRFIIPKMRKWPRLKEFFRKIMVTPFLRFGEWYYEIEDMPGKKYGFLMSPVVLFWLTLWTILGYAHKYFTRSHSWNH